MQRAPDEPNAVTYLGATYLNEKKYPQAISFFKKSIAINARDVTAYSNMARAFYFSQQYDAAIDAVNKELAIDQHSGLRDLPYVALSFEKKGDMANAKKYEAMAKQVYSNFKLD